MRLYLAAIVVMLAIIACTDAQEGTIEQNFATFTEQMNEMSKKFANQAKTTFEGISTSEFAVSTKNWFQEQLDKLKLKIQDFSSK